MTAKAMNAGTVAMTGASRKTGLSTAAGDDVLLQRQLDAVGEALQQPERARAGSGPRRMLHAPDDPALDPDRQQRDHTGRRKRQTTLTRMSHHGSWPNDGGRGPRSGHHGSLLDVGRPAPTGTPTSRPVRDRGARRIGTHTTRSGMSATARGSVISPRSVETVTGPPSVGADLLSGRGREAGERGVCRAREVRFAVLHPARVQHHPPGREHRLPGPGAGGGSAGTSGSGRSAGRIPRASSSARAPGASPKPKRRPSSRRACRAPVGRAARRCRAAPRRTGAGGPPS